MKVFSCSWNNNGELVIKVSKYNNLFDISLIKGADKQSLKKTKIHVFRDTPSKLKKDEEPFYNNTRVRDKKSLVKVGNLVKNSYLYR